MDPFSAGRFDASEGPHDIPQELDLSDLQIDVAVPKVEQRTIEQVREEMRTKFAAAVHERFGENFTDPGEEGQLSSDGLGLLEAFGTQAMLQHYDLELFMRNTNLNKWDPRSLTVHEVKDDEGKNPDEASCKDPYRISIQFECRSDRTSDEAGDKKAFAVPFDIPKTTMEGDIDLASDDQSVRAINGTFVDFDASRTEIPSHDMRTGTKSQAADVPSWVDEVKEAKKAETVSLDFLSFGDEQGQEG